MDFALEATDSIFWTPYVYPSTWKEDWWLRQFISLFIMVNLGGYLLYFFTSVSSFYFMFDHRLMKHKYFLKNQIRREITITCVSIPLMAIPTTALFVLEIRGYSKLYDNVADYGWGYFLFTVLFFLFFTDMCIYFIHRGLHYGPVYKHIHKPHHYWIVPTPFASHAFHPIDGFLQSSPYHIFVFLFPLHKFLYLGLFVFVNFWTTSIHDANYKVPDSLKNIINCSAHHTDHHLYFDYNYGQFFTLWDKLCGSHRSPSAFEGKGPLDQLLKDQTAPGAG